MAGTVAAPPHERTPSADSPAQLAGLLSSALTENEALKHELDKARLRADAAERRLRKGPTQELTGGGDAAAAERIAELEARLTEAVAERGELEARIKRFQVDWADCNRLLHDAEAAANAARAQFSNIVAARGGTFHEIGARNGAFHVPWRGRAY